MCVRSSITIGSIWRPQRPPRPPRRAHSMRHLLRVLCFLRFSEKVMFFVIFLLFFACVHFSIASRIFFRRLGAPGRLPDALWAAPAASSKPGPAKEARRYATFCVNCCQFREFPKCFRVLQAKLEKILYFWRAPSSPRQLGLL